MPVGVSDTPRFVEAPEGGWWLRGWASSRMTAGITTRHLEASHLLQALGGRASPVQAEQVHGSSIAAIGRTGDILRSPSGDFATIPACDALLTDVPGVALLVKTADCLPLFFADPSRGVVGIAHVGWRGLAASLPGRVVSALQHLYHSQPAQVHVAVGPAIRACCYEVGPEFIGRFTPFVRGDGDRRRCDLVGAAIAQVRACGIRPHHVVDSRACTACEVDRWFSMRREGPGTGRLTSLIMLRGGTGSRRPAAPER